MITEFYLLCRSFECPASITMEQLKLRIKNLAILHEHIRESDETIYCPDSIYYISLFDNVLLCDALYTNKGDILGRDVQVILRKIIDHANKVTLCDDDIIRRTISHSEEVVIGLVGLYVLDDPDRRYFLFALSDWYVFHRYFLSLYPTSYRHFLSECRKYFPDLYFHDNVEHTLSGLQGGLLRFASTIIKCLSSLNDDFKRLYVSTTSIMDCLRQFSSLCSFETSLEGNVTHKNKLTFRFINKDDVSIDVYCEPHMKLDRSTIRGDTRLYFNRIYFHQGKDDIQNGKILVGHIGKHPNF